MSDFNDSTPIATPGQYRAALLAVRQRMTDVHLKLLQAHCRSDGHATSTDRLAEAVGMATASSAKTAYSNYAHWIADERFRGAIAEALGHERSGIGDYVDELSERTPFRSGVR